jgi:hypothetical protein
MYKEVIKRGITENNKQQNNQNEETIETKWQNIRILVTMVASEVVGYEELKERNDCYDEECQIKVKERNKVLIKMLNSRMRMKTDNYKTNESKPRKCAQGEKREKERSNDIKVLEGEEEANK